MASSAKCPKYNSKMDEIIAVTVAMKPDTAPVKSVPNTEINCLPNEILVKIFGYLDIQDISRSAQVSHQFNMISKDSSVWQSWRKVIINGIKVPTEFLTYIIQRGITELILFQCEILPPRVNLTEFKRPLNLKTLSLDGTKGDKTLVNDILISHPLEKVELRQCMNNARHNITTNMMSENDISQFIESLPQIGSQLKNLNLENDLFGKFHDLSSISSIVNTCLGLEELNLCCNMLNEEAISYLCENLTSNILKLDIGIGYWGTPRGLNDNNIKALVKRCPKLKVLDIRTNELVTYQGLVAIIEGLSSLEYLGLPSIVIELGLPHFDNIDLSKLHRLKSMKNLKELLIGDYEEDSDYSKVQQRILKREIPHLREHVGGQIFTDCCNDFEVAVTDFKEFRRIEFCPICHEYDKHFLNHKCPEK